MPNLLNGLVNGWVKVNSKHVIFPRDEHRRERRDSNASLDDSSSRILDLSWGKSRKQSPQTVSTTQSTSDPEADAIKKFNSKRQNKRRLQRTISHSDLLREMANGGTEGKSKSSSTRDSTTNNSRTSSYDSNKTGNRTNDESVRQVAGFFGSDVGDKEENQTNGVMEQRSSSSPSKRPQQKGPVTTGKYLNEAMFVQQLERASQAGRRSAESSAAGSSTTASSAASPIREHSRRTALSLDSSQDHHHHEYRPRIETNSHGGGIILGRFQRIDSAASRHGHATTAASQGQHHHGQDGHCECVGCKDMENRLLAAYDDIRYLRDVSLRSEYSRAPQKPKNSILRGSNHEVTTLSEASKRLSEITGRHRRQIEQMTRETVSTSRRVYYGIYCLLPGILLTSLPPLSFSPRQSRKQHDIHFKHSKTSMICKTLNDESSIRKQEALALEEEVQDLKMERNELATQVERLRAEASLFQQEQQEHLLLRKRMTAYENDSLEQADKAIKERDVLIGELSTRLERTLETLEIEREQQRQRRQIIFPGTKSLQHASSTDESTDVAALQEELRKVREAARASEALLETTKAEAAKREIALTVRCENLESRLKEQTLQDEE